jgi:hypothetical protein
MKTLPQQSWRSALSFVTKVLCAFSICLSSTHVLSGPLTFTPVQTDYMASVKMYTQDPEVASMVRAIMFVETTAGTTNKSNGNCHGIMQINTKTAIGILKDHQEIGDQWGVNWHSYKDVTYKLINTPLFGVQLAVAHVTDMLAKGISVDRAILAYNVGEPGALHLKRVRTPYVQKVRYMMTEIDSSPVVKAEYNDIQ